MKKWVRIAFGYAIAAMAGGVFYREFTKFNGFTGVTALGKVHVHLFMLGMFLSLLVALLIDRVPLKEQKTFHAFETTYLIGVPLTAIMLLARGIPQVLGQTLSSGVSGAISGIAGVAHILTGVSIILLLLALMKAADAGKKA